MNRLKSLREEKGMKQSELGKLLNVQDAAISKYESGKVPLTGDTLLKLSKIFNVSTDYLLGASSSRNSDSSANERGLSDDKPNDNQSRDKDFFFFFFFDDKDLQEVFVSALKTALETQNMTVSELCEKTEIDVDTCNQYLTGERAPTLEHLVELSKALDVSIDYLLGQVPKISQAEKKLLNAFENLSEDNQDIIIGKTKELLREQRFDNPPVAADENRKASGK